MRSSSTRRSPRRSTDHWFDRWRADQQATIGAIEADFAPTPVRTADLSDHEIQGVEALRSLGKDLWDGVDAAARLVDRRPWRVESAGADMVLTIELPTRAQPRSVSTGSATS